MQERTSLLTDNIILAKQQTKCSIGVTVTERALGLIQQTHREAAGRSRDASLKIGLDVKKQRQTDNIPKSQVPFTFCN